MPHDPLTTVLRLRRRAMDDVRSALANTLAQAARAEESAREAERSIEAEAERASDPAGPDSLVEAFAAWLPGARHRVAQARALQDRHQAEAARLRAELAASRTALEAIEQLITQRADAAATRARQQAQNAMDEAAARTHARP